MVKCVVVVFLEVKIYRFNGGEWGCVGGCRVGRLGGLSGWIGWLTRVDS